MHTIKITPNLLFEYQCTSGKYIRLPNRIESKLFLLELECSTVHDFCLATPVASSHASRRRIYCVRCFSVDATLHALLPRCGNITSVGWQVTLCDPTWHVSSRSGVATSRTAIHLLLTYLLMALLFRLLVCPPESMVCGQLSGISQLYWRTFVPY